MSEEFRPKVPATRVGNQCTFWCAWCEEWHWHGSMGHKVAHCWSERSPYRSAGYVLVPGEDVARLRHGPDEVR